MAIDLLAASETSAPKLHPALSQTRDIDRAGLFGEKTLSSEQDLSEVVGEVVTASVATGVLGVGGNKGAVALGFTLHRRRLAFVGSHFAAHQGAVEARNANYAQIASQLAFRRTVYVEDSDSDDERSPDARALAKGASRRSHEYAELESDAASSAEEVNTSEGEGMRTAEMLVWLGDFNYRIAGERDAVVSQIRRFLKGDPSQLKALLRQDQLKQEMGAGHIFRFLHEAPIAFAPTYKFDKADASPLAYDSSEKARVPAWTDRIFFRGSEITRTAHQSALQHVDGGNPEAPEPALAAEEIRVKATSYVSVPAALESDHKPVLAALSVSMPVTDQAERRRHAAAILLDADAKAAAAEGQPSVHLTPHSGTVTLEAGSPPAKQVELVNRGEAPAVFTLGPALGGSVGRNGLPSWLAARPVSGLLPPNGRVALHLGAHHLDTSTTLQAKLAVRVQPLTVLGGARQEQQYKELRLVVTRKPAAGPLAALRQNAATLSYR